MVKRKEEKENSRHTPCRRARPAFSLIEVMVSVILITTVIGALLQLFANNTHLLGGMQGRIDHTLRSSLLLGNPQYGFEQQQKSLDNLVEEFDLDDSLRRRLKGTQLSLGYRADLQLNDASLMGAESVEEETEAASAAESGGFVLEIGLTSFMIDDQRSTWTRLRLQ